MPAPKPLHDTFEGRQTPIPEKLANRQNAHHQCSLLLRDVGPSFEQPHAVLQHKSRVDGISEFGSFQVRASRGWVLPSSRLQRSDSLFTNPDSAKKRVVATHIPNQREGGQSSVSKVRIATYLNPVSKSSET